jgi:hypothetical protein
MLDVMLTDYWRNYQRLRQALRDVMWRCVAAQCQLSTTMWDALLAGSRPGFSPPAEKAEAAAPPGAEVPKTVEEQARQRLSQGLAPPREIYDVRNRDRIDWSQVPDWARPLDPEVFEGCGHEG